MTYYLKQRVFSWGDHFSIYDAQGNEAYQVQGEVFTFGKKLHLCDLQGNELAYVEQKLLTLLPKYDISLAGQWVAEVVKEFTFFHPAYTVTPLGWQVKGDFFNHDYDVYADGNVVARVNKEWFTLGDAYRIDIEPEYDPTLVLAVVLVIDACLEAQKN